jgi:hypothetical protein
MTFGYHQVASHNGRHNMTHTYRASPNDQDTLKAMCQVVPELSDDEYRAMLSEALNTQPTNTHTQGNTQ